MDGGGGGDGSGGGGGGGVCSVVSLKPFVNCLRWLDADTRPPPSWPGSKFQ